MGNHLKDFFSNEYLKFIGAVAIPIIVAFYAIDTVLKIVVIAGYGVGVVLAAVIYKFYKEKIESATYARENKRLHSEIEQLTSQKTELLRQVQRQPHTVLYKKTAQISTLKNEDGDAEITYDYEGINSNDKPLEKIEHAIEYDSPEPVLEVEAYNNNIKVQPKISTLSIQDVTNTDKPSHFRTKIIFDFLAEPIPANAIISQRYDLTVKKAFHKAFQNNDKDYTSHRVKSQTEKLVIKVIAPSEYKFTSWDIRIADAFGIQDDIERNRMRTENRPTIIGNSTLNWEITDPKISYVYYIDFSLQRT